MSRINEMFEIGWIEEVEVLRNMGHTPDLPGLDAIGYGDVFSYIDGRVSYEGMRSKIIKDTLDYSKNQYKW